MSTVNSTITARFDEHSEFPRAKWHTVSTGPFVAVELGWRATIIVDSAEDAAEIADAFVNAARMLMEHTDETH